MERQPLEKTVQARIVKALQGEGVAWVLKTYGGPYQRAGIPDILCIAPNTGRLVGIEVKRAAGIEPTALQKAQLRKINSAGGVAGCAYDVDGALRLLWQADGR